MPAGAQFSQVSRDVKEKEVGGKNTANLIGNNNDVSTESAAQGEGGAVDLVLLTYFLYIFFKALRRLVMCCV